MKHYLEILSAFFAIAAAILWFFSARARVPETYQNRDAGGIGMGEMADQLRALGTGVRKQSRLSAWAAICAGAVALIQAFAAFI